MGYVAEELFGGGGNGSGLELRNGGEGISLLRGTWTV